MVNDLKKYFCLFLVITFAIVSALFIDRKLQSVSWKNSPIVNDSSHENIYVPPQVASPDVCSEDQAKYCSKVSGVFNMSLCLYENHQKISAACLNQLQSRQNTLSVCSHDIEEKCPGMTLMDVEVRSCLKKNESDLSSVCKGLVSL